MKMACLVLRQCNHRLLQSLIKFKPISTSSGQGLWQSLHKCRAMSISTLHSTPSPVTQREQNFVLCSENRHDTQCKKMSLCCRSMTIHQARRLHVRTFCSLSRKRAKRSYAESRGNQNEFQMPKHHADKLQLDFDDQDLAQLLREANNLVSKESFKDAGVGGQEAEQMMENLVKYLCFCQCSPDNILHTLEENPGLLKIPWSSLQALLLLLEEIGLRRGQLLKALNRNDALWSMDRAAIRKRLAQLRQIGFNEDLRKIVAKWPRILTISDKVLNNAVEALKESDFSREEIKTIVKDHPRVLGDSPQDIMLKFQYVHFCMGITEGKELVHGKIFRYSMDHIRCRHILLERMGLYKSPDKHKIDSAKNPQLQLIIDTTDKRFCHKVAARISKEDYEIFKRNLKDELKDVGLEGGESGSDSDYLSEYDEDSNADDTGLDYDSESSSGSDIDR